MEYYYLFLVIILFAFAVSDLIVGVSNDAVNFLNSAVGSKAASYRVIMVIAGLGILIGATFSSGMMEVARSSIFNPDMFTFKEIMVVFLAVMIADVLLLDLFNTFGLPTSTTVSIVFDLLGASLAVATMKMISLTQNMSGIGAFINSDRALGIITGIFISIIIAFTIGAIIQWIVRILFTFNLGKSIKYWGGLWGGFAISAILYFLLVKGIKGASFIHEQQAEWIAHNSGRLILLSFVITTILFQLIIFFTKFNILRLIVLFGTFALAMAFAGNDLVNFIGVPLAGYESFKAFAASGMEPGNLLMEVLNGPVKTPTYFLLAAGVIMALTLRFSKKARSVTVTTLDLSRQAEGRERFESTSIARFIVRHSVDLSNFIAKYTPVSLQSSLNKRFEPQLTDKKSETVAFDMVRASVNLVVASILISIGTSLKLPLSTTYVTFMVAMGTSLSDKAWGRESAVYRITGVITVIGGWFMTALAAFTASFLIATLIYFGGIVIIVIMILLAIFIFIRTSNIHKRREAANEKNAKQYHGAEKISTIKAIESTSSEVTSILIKISKLYFLAILNFVKEKRKELHSVKKQIKELNKETRNLKDNLHLTLRKMEEEEVETGHYYVQILDYLREATNCLQFIIGPMYSHVDNNHPMLIQPQVDELLSFNDKMSEFFNVALTILDKKSYDHTDDLKKQRDRLLSTINDMRKKQIKLIKKEGKGTKVSLVFLDVMTESKNMLLFVTNVVEAHKAFVEYGKHNGGK